MNYTSIILLWTIVGVVSIPILIEVIPAVVMTVWDALYDWSLMTLAQITEHRNDVVGRHWQHQEEDDNFFLAILQERRAVLAGLQREWNING